jgi:hypothetical protein
MAKINNIFLLFILIIVNSCETETKKIDNLHQDNHQVLKDQQVKSDLMAIFIDTLENRQVFVFEKGELIKVKGNEGTCIEINPNILIYEDGNISKEQVKIELIEYYSASDLILNSLTTHSSKNNLLQTSGMIDLKVTSNGKRLKIKENKKYKISFPFNGKPLLGMHLYKGDFEKNVMIWNDTNVKTNSLSVDTFFNEGLKVPFFQKQLTDYLFETNIDFGLINCDKEFEGENKTSIVLQIDSIVNPGSTIIFPQLKMVAGYTKEGDKYKFYNIPNGEKATILSYYQKDGECFLFIETMIIKSNQILIPNYVKMEKSEMKKKIEQIYWEPS